MSLQAAIEQALPGLCAEAESRMTSRCTIKRGGVPMPDPDDPEMEIVGWATVHDDLPVRIGGAERGGSGSRTVRVGDVEVQVATRVAHLPVSTAGLRDGDVIGVTSGETAPAWFQIVEAAGADQQTALRVPVIEVSEPGRWS